MSLEQATGERGLWYYDEEKKRLSRFRPAKRVQVHQVITDDIHNGIIAPFNQRMYHSKSRLRADARALGLVEIGNEDQSKVAERIQRDQEKEERRATHEALLEAWARRMGE